MARLVSKLQEERSGAVLIMMTNLDDVDFEDIKKVGLDMKNRFLSTDAALDQIQVWRQPEDQDMFASKLRWGK